VINHANVFPKYYMYVAISILKPGLILWKEYSRNVVTSDIFDEHSESDCEMTFTAESFNSFTKD